MFQMFVFLDESFRVSKKTGQKFGFLGGVAVPEAAVRALQAGVYAVRKPYHGTFLREDDEIKGKELLGGATFKCIKNKGFSYQYNLAEEMLQFIERSGFRFFGVACFDESLHSFSCSDESLLDKTFKCLFNRINYFASQQSGGSLVKLVFDDRTHKINKDNAKAITNFLVKSPVGRSYSALLPYPLFAVSQSHNYGLQLADVAVTVAAKHYAGDQTIEPLWEILSRSIVRFHDGSRRWSSIKVLDPNKK